MCYKSPVVSASIAMCMWKLYVNQDITTANMDGVTLESVGISQCLQACLSNANGVCPAVAYDTLTSTCRLKLTNRSDETVTFGAKSNTDYYQPYCSGKPVKHFFYIRIALLIKQFNLNWETYRYKKA